MTSTKYRILVQLTVLITLTGCNPQDSTPKTGTASPPTEGHFLDAKINLTPDEQGELARATAGGATDIHVIEKGGKLTFIKGAPPSGARLKPETKVLITNHSDKAASQLEVKASPEALQIMQMRQTQAGRG
jgi:hypothetical protein